MSTIKVIALKPFVYSVDGYTEIPVQEHETFNLPERFFQGLNDARYVRRATIGDGKVSLNPSPDEIAKKVEPIVETAMKLKDALTTIAETGKLPSKAEPAELTDKEKAAIADGTWKDFKWFGLRSLASKFGLSPKDGKEAIAAIEAELARREG